MAAPDSRGSGGGRWIRSALADGGSGSDDGTRQKTETHRATQADTDGCTRLKWRRRLRQTRDAAAAVGGSDQSWQTAAVAVMTADGDSLGHTETSPTQTAAPDSRGGDGCV